MVTTIKYMIYDIMHDFHWKTGRQAARLMYHINYKELKMF